MKIEAFIRIENALASRLKGAWDDISTGWFDKVKQLVSDGKWEEARQYIRTLSLSPIFDKEKEYIKFYTKSAFLFGVSRFGPIKKSIHGKNFPQGLEKFNLLIQETFEGDATKKFREGLIRLIDTLQQEDITKGEDYNVVIKLDVVKPFVSFANTQKGILQLIAGLHTSRVSSYGFVAEAEALGVTKYAVNEQLDNRICPVCIEMHGKEFDVQDARESINTILSTKPEDIHLVQPWPKQDARSLEAFKKLSNAELVAHNWHMPPYHPFCRGLLVKVGTVPPLKLDRNYQTNLEELKSWGVKGDVPGAMKYWNEHVRIPVAIFMEYWLGRDSKDIFSDIQNSKIKEHTFLYNDLGDNLLWGGIDTNGLQSLLSYDGRKKDFYLNLVVLHHSLQGKNVLKPVMTKWLDLATLLDAETISLRANLDVGGYAWAKYGFVPDYLSWIKLVETLRKDIQGLEISEKSLMALDAILSSNDPKGIWLIASMKEKVEGVSLGKKLLLGKPWDGVLNLTDEDAMKIFHTYIG